ncbi:DNA repair protein complementing XP-A cells homolog [Episyrphus balteatus]|uniref:DNA repair protein complementing XP-A cells homolog n=1 Tax=Episyrphus balteatus TaxID=286459 RepID=UPI0024864702|nr:DNA repair protein complementing XP-A cells homolog [Episyrphus balteatus]
MEEQPEKKETKLTAAQLSRIERNRIKAESLRKGKIVSNPYSINKNDLNAPGCKVFKGQSTRLIDSGGGFLIEAPLLANQAASSNTPAVKPYVEPPVTFPLTYTDCLECGDKFNGSYLLDNFDHAVCDKCREPEEKHALITKTEAKAEYLLKDCDFDRREPVLKFISKKNARYTKWGEMKLYLLLQVQKRALEVWGSEDEVVKQQEERDEKRLVTKVKRYNKQMKQLRMEVRSSLYTKKLKAAHVHEFGPENYNEEEDTYSHSCVSCEYSESYEKM